MSSSDHRRARFGVRLGAGTVDLTLLALAAAVLTWLGVELHTDEISSRADLLGVIGQLWRDLLIIPFGVITVVGAALCWWRLLATPGQLLMGCRTRRFRRHAALNLPVALWRSVAMFALVGPLAVPLITLFVDRGRRAAHDWLSDSVVVMEDESRVLIEEWLSRLE